MVNPELYLRAPVELSDRTVHISWQKHILAHFQPFLELEEAAGEIRFSSFFLIYMENNLHIVPQQLKHSVQLHYATMPHTPINTLISCSFYVYLIHGPPPGGGGVLLEISVYRWFWPKLVYLGPPQAGFFLVYLRVFGTKIVYLSFFDSVFTMHCWGSASVNASLME